MRAVYPDVTAGLCGYRDDDEWHYGDPDTEATCAVCLDLWRNRSRWSRFRNRFRRPLDDTSQASY